MRGFLLTYAYAIVKAKISLSLGTTCGPHDVTSNCYAKCTLAKHLLNVFPRFVDKTSASGRTLLNATALGMASYFVIR